MSYFYIGLPQWLNNEESAWNAGDTEEVSSIPGSGRSPRGRNGNPLQYSHLKSTMDREVWRTTVHEGAKESDMIL